MAINFDSMSSWCSIRIHLLHERHNQPQEQDDQLSHLPRHTAMYNLDIIRGVEAFMVPANKYDHPVLDEDISVHIGWKYRGIIGKTKLPSSEIIIRRVEIS